MDDIKFSTIKFSNNLRIKFLIAIFLYQICLILTRKSEKADEWTNKISYNARSLVSHDENLAKSSAHNVKGLSRRFKVFCVSEKGFFFVELR